MGADRPPLRACVYVALFLSLRLRPSGRDFGGVELIRRGLHMKAVRARRPASVTLFKWVMLATFVTTLDSGWCYFTSPFTTAALDMGIEWKTQRSLYPPIA